MKAVAILVSMLFLFVINAKSQGSIPVRNISGFGQYNLTSNAFTTSQWQIKINSRYFKAYHDFKEKADIRISSAKQDIIKSFSMQLKG